jgi:outer membrane immunogenic protein
MKIFFLTTTALVIAGPALAAEPQYSWSGCYIGGHFGAGRDKTTYSEPTEPGFQFFAPADASMGIADTGALGGVQAGCDLQFARNWLVGVGGDFSFANINGQTADPFFAGKNGDPILLNAKTDRTGTLTARLGYAWNRLLLFGEGGAAVAHDKYSVQNLIFFGNPNAFFCAAGGPIVGCNPSGNETRWGWTAGVGVEWAFTDLWALGLKYTHYSFASHAVQLPDPDGVLGPVTGPVNVKQSIEAVKLSLNYRFAWPLAH